MGDSAFVEISKAPFAVGAGFNVCRAPAVEADAPRGLSAMTPAATATTAAASSERHAGATDTGATTAAKTSTASASAEGWSG